MIAHNKPTVGNLEKKFLNEVFEKNYFSQHFQVKKFEEEFSKYLELSNENVAAVSNGTTALYLALKVLNPQKKNIFFPSYSCSSLMHAVKLANLKPKLLDNKKNSHNMDGKIDLKNETIIFPQMYGYPSILRNKNKSTIIEDACQCLGAEINGKPVGLQGKVGIFSFYATKLITTGGQGGMVVSKDKTFISEVKDFIDFDKRRDDKLRFNFQMTEIQAAFGRAQLRNIKSFIQKRSKIFKIYKKSGLKFIENNNPRVKPVNYRAILLTKNINKVIKFFKKNNIQVINPLLNSELLGPSYKFPNAANYTKKTISLPCYPSLNFEEISHIRKVLDKFKNEF